MTKVERLAQDGHIHRAVADRVGVGVAGDDEGRQIGSLLAHFADQVGARLFGHRIIGDQQVVMARPADQFDRDLGICTNDTVCDGGFCVAR